MNDLNDDDKPAPPANWAPEAQAPPSSAAPGQDLFTAKEDERLNLFLDNADNYIDGQAWLDGMAGQGIAMTDEEKSQWEKALKKRKRDHTTVGGFHHFEIYQMSKTLAAKYEASGLIKLPTGSRGNQVHPIAQAIMKSRRLIKRADANSVVDPEFIRLINLERNRDKTEFYYVSQRDFLRNVFRQYGVDTKNGEKFHSHDVLRLFGLLLTDEDLRDYVPDLMNESKSGTRQEIDAAPGRIRAAYRLASTHFIDKEKVVPMPPNWKDEETREKINGSSQPGVYEEHGANLNPNDQSRMDKV